MAGLSFGALDPIRDLSWRPEGPGWGLSMSLLAPFRPLSEVPEAPAMAEAPEGSAGSLLERGDIAIAEGSPLISGQYPVFRSALDTSFDNDMKSLKIFFKLEIHPIHSSRLIKKKKCPFFNFHLF